MPSTSLTIVKRRVISILMANRLNPYAGTIPTPATNSRYQSTTEIEDAALEADAIIVQARISTPGDPYRNTWVSFTPDLAHASLIPAHIGSVGGVEVKVGSVYTPARFASSKAEILAMRAHPALYPDAKNWVWIENSELYHNGDFARVWRSTFSKSAACQSPEQDQTAVIALTLGSLAKDGSVTPEIYDAGTKYGMWYIQSVIKGQSVSLPEVEQIESALAA
jgi:hypothetical protein